MPISWPLRQEDPGHLPGQLAHIRAATSAEIGLQFAPQLVWQGVDTGPTESTFACMKAVYYVGCNFYDCGESWADGENEKVMAEAVEKYG